MTNACGSPVRFSGYVQRVNGFNFLFQEEQCEEEKSVTVFDLFGWGRDGVTSGVQHLSLRRRQCVGCNEGAIILRAWASGPCVCLVTWERLQLY